jgi:hypothetical protein
MRWTLITTVSLQIGSVAIGYWWGKVVHYAGRAPTNYTYCAMVGCLLVITAIFRSFKVKDSDSKYLTTVSALTLFYCVGIALYEPFFEVHNPISLMIAFIFLVPLLLVIGYFVMCRAWFSTAGVVLFLVASVAMIENNSRIADAGSGFFSTWLT